MPPGRPGGARVRKRSRRVGLPDPPDELERPATRSWGLPLSPYFLRVDVGLLLTVLSGVVKPPPVVEPPLSGGLGGSKLQSP
jgi:hypothetical protein